MAIRGLFEAFTLGDHDRQVGFLAPDVEWHEGSDVPVASPTVYDAYTLRDGLVVRRELFGTRAELAAAVGIEP